MMQLGTLPGLPIRPRILATPQRYVSLFSVIPDIFNRESTFNSLVIPDIRYRESILVFFGWIPADQRRG